jgi:hypothetical protein
MSVVSGRTGEVECHYAASNPFAVGQHGCVSAKGACPRSRPFTTVLVKDSFGSSTARFFRAYARGPKVRGRIR